MYSGSLFIMFDNEERVLKCGENKTDLCQGARYACQKRGGGGGGGGGGGAF